MGQRLLLINANTDPAITDRIVAAARAIVPPGIEPAGATARFGARYIATRAAYAIAAHAALDALAGNAGKADGVLLACFGDPGLSALREAAAVPVVGMAEGSCRRAARRFRRFAIVTGGALWPDMLREFLGGIGLLDQVAGIRAVAATGARIAADPEGSRALLAKECMAAVREDGADAVILGGAGLVGIARQIAPDVSVPVLDSLEESLGAAIEEMGRGSGPHAPVAQAETTGLSPHLAGLLGKGARPL